MKVKTETTKEKIIRVSIQLFNEQGISNVTLRNIAKEAGLSAGNLTYHYRTKQDLVLAAYRYIADTFEQIPFLDHLVFQGGMGLNLARQAMEYVMQFPFFFQDTLEVFRQHPEIQKLHSRQVDRMKQLIQHHIFIAVGKGIMIPEPLEGHYDQLVRSIWMTIDLWIVRQVLLGESPNNIQEGLKAVGSLIYPHYTVLGKQIYAQKLKEMEMNRILEKDA